MSYSPVVSYWRSRELSYPCILGYYAVSSCNFLPKFLVNISGHTFRGKVFLTHEDGTDMLSRNAGKKLPLLAA